MDADRTPLQRATELLDRHQMDALLVGPGADLVSLCGYHAHAAERMTLMVVRRDGRHRLIVPELERPAALAGLAHEVPVQAYPEGADHGAQVRTALEGLDPLGVVGVGDGLWSLFLLQAQGAVDAAAWRSATPVTRELRMVKDDAGVSGLRAAGAAIDRVHRRMGEFVRPGLTERQAGQAIAAAMREEGHEAVEFVIVASGPNGASPHHGVSDRVLTRGDAVVVDIGGTVDGWFSDCTRNYVIGHAPEGYEAAFGVLHAAQAAAVAAVRPQVTAGSVDAAARTPIAEAGYGEAFVHRTGHGIGLDCHEEPYITADSDLTLQPGMAFSVEPGVYLEGRFGMRIEDIVVVTADGVERLNTTSTDLVVLDA